ncbi:MAG: alpha-galactosidase, partial [Muribaculaceae bacterium]|nr:alpha-galactosidase [Muribaculaceae bacterium]
MKKFLLTMAIALTLTGGTAFSQANKTHVLSSDNSSLVVTTNDGGTAYYQYFGPKILDKDIPGFFDTNSNYTANTIPAFGLNSYGEQALAVKFPDGNMSLDLYMESMDRRKDDKGEIIQLTFKDKVYPLTVTQYFRTYDGTDIFSTWMDFTNTGKKGNIDLLTFASAYVPVTRGDNWLTQFHGSWGSESWMSQERLPNGQSVLADKAGLRNAFGTNPGFMITIDG